MKFYKVIRTIGAWQKDAIVELDEPTAAGLVATAVLEESNVSDYTRSQTASMLGESETRIMARLDEIARGMVPTNFQIPGQGQQYSDKGVEAAHVRPGEAAAERGVQCFADILRCVFHVQAKNAPRGMADLCEERLERVYKFEKRKYEMDGQGRFFSIDTNPATGVVTRTGTESLSGGPTYGFLVKPEWYSTLYRIMIEESVLINDAFQVPIGNALELKWPALDQFGTPIAGQSASYAGVVVTRAGETQQRIYSDGKVYEIDFKITDLTGFSTLSRDLIADNFIAADSLIQELFGMAFAWKFDYECLLSPGVGSPLGVFNSNALITGGGISGNAGRVTANQILYADLAWMLSRVHPSCWKDMFWVTNVTTLPWLMGIQTAANTFAYQPNSLVSQAMTPTVKDDVSTRGFKFKAGGTLLGYPVKFSEKVPALGTQGDLTLIHPRSYGIAARSGLEVGLSEHFLFDTDTIAFRFKMRNDARPLWRAPFTQADGASTKVGPFVQLV